MVFGAKLPSRSRGGIDWANKITKIANSSDQKMKLVALGNERIDLFSLQKMFTNYESTIIGKGE